MTDSEMLAAIRALLPDTYSESKDWRTGNVTERIIWLKGMLENKKEEVDRLIDILNDNRISAQAAEIERLEKACAEWAEVSQSNYQRAKAAEAKLAKALDALHEAWFMLTGPMLNYEPEPEEPGLRRIKYTLAELTGGKDE